MTACRSYTVAAARPLGSASIAGAESSCLNLQKQTTAWSWYVLIQMVKINKKQKTHIDGFNLLVDLLVFCGDLSSTTKHKCQNIRRYQKNIQHSYPHSLILCSLETLSNRWIHAQAELTWLFVSTKHILTILTSPPMGQKTWNPLSFWEHHDVLLITVSFRHVSGHDCQSFPIE